MKISFPDYVVHTDTELEHVRNQYFELAKKGEERNCQMSKDLRCRLIRNSMTSMIAILRAKGGAGSDRYPSKPEVTAMARRIVQYYPMLQDLNNKNTWVGEMYPVDDLSVWHFMWKSECFTFVLYRLLCMDSCTKDCKT